MDFVGGAERGVILHVIFPEIMVYDFGYFGIAMFPNDFGLSKKACYADPLTWFRVEENLTLEVDAALNYDLFA
jgi:hypothetical protein